MVRDIVMVTLVDGSLSSGEPSAISVTTSAFVSISPSSSNVAPVWPRALGATAAERRIIGAEGYALATPSNTALAANTIYFAPFHWRGGMVVKNGYIQITTAAAGKFIRGGIYDISSGKTAFKKMLEFGPMDVSATGMVSAAITPIVLPPGWYAAAFLTDGAPAVCTYSTTTETPFGWAAATATLKIIRLQQSQTYGALPNTINVSSAAATNSTSSTGLICMWLSD